MDHRGNDRHGFNGNETLRYVSPQQRIIAVHVTTAVMGRQGTCHNGKGPVLRYMSPRQVTIAVRLSTNCNRIFMTHTVWQRDSPVTFFFFLFFSLPCGVQSQGFLVLLYFSTKSRGFTD